MVFVTQRRVAIAMERVTVLLREGWSLEAACARAGINPSTVRRLRERARAGVDPVAVRIAWEVEGAAPLEPMPRDRPAIFEILAEKRARNGGLGGARWSDGDG
jgi:hypothetical protein